MIAFLKPLGAAAERWKRGSRVTGCQPLLWQDPCGSTGREVLPLFFKWPSFFVAKVLWHTYKPCLLLQRNAAEITAQDIKKWSKYVFTHSYSRKQVSVYSLICILSASAFYCRISPVCSIWTSAAVGRSKIIELQLQLLQRLKSPAIFYNIPCLFSTVHQKWCAELRERERTLPI